jgi:hypothetical protein
MENENYNNGAYDHESGQAKQDEYNRKLEDKTPNSPVDTASRTGAEKDIATDTGYKQKDAEEMQGEVTRKHREENLEHGGEEAPDDVAINEGRDISDKNTILENTKERATIDLSGRSVI